MSYDDATFSKCLLSAMRKLEKGLWLRNNPFMQSLRSRLPPVNSLVAFEASARHLSFTRAGQELLISREAVSRQIRILESYLGVKLFNRLYRALELTEAGQSFQSVVGESLENIGRETINLQRLTQPTKITVSGTVAITSFWLTPRFPQFRAEHPDVEIRVHVSDEPPDMLAEGIDVGLQYGNGIWPGLKATELFRVESFPVCSPGYLKISGPISSPSDLREQALLYLDGAQHSEENWNWWMEEFDLSLPSSVRTFGFDNYANVIQAALDGQGVALGFSDIIEDLLSKGLLVRPMEQTCVTGYSVYLVVPNGMTLSSNAELFHDWIVSEAKTAQRRAQSLHD